ncbi:MAG: hypothetical protein ACT4PT_04890 [Methanobacteriota archaeon]
MAEAGTWRKLQYLTPYERRRTSLGVLAAAILLLILGLLVVNLDVGSSDALLLVFVIFLALLAAFMVVLVKSEEKPASLRSEARPTAAARPPRPEAARPGPAPATGGTRRVSLRCRGCGGTINVILSPNLASVTCPNCGRTGPPPS